MFEKQLAILISNCELNFPTLLDTDIGTCIPYLGRFQSPFSCLVLPDFFVINLFNDLSCIFIIILY